MEGGPRGMNLPCAALSLLARSAWECLLAIPGLSVEGQAEEEGSFDLRVGLPVDDNRGLVRGATLFLLTGLAGLERDFPEGIGVQIKRIRRDSHGGQERQRT